MGAFAALLILYMVLGKNHFVPNGFDSDSRVTAFRFASTWPP